MFKTAATKIAHNSTLPALSGNQDLRPLQDLITAEKSVIISLQKLSVDYAKAAEMLKSWGVTEGDDIGDILTASSIVLNHFSASLSQYASHGHTIREQLKAVRTREEALDELKRRRRVIVRKADDAEKKLSKMSPEHKNVGMQTETLNRLRDEIRAMDSDIMIEEAALGDFKRTTTKMCVGLKFAGLLECSERGKIAAEYGKAIISELPEDLTQPGLPRSLYYGHAKTESLVAETNQHMAEVQLTTVPTVGFRDRRQYDSRQPQRSQFMQEQQQQPPYPMGPGSAGGAPPPGWPSSDSKPQPLPPSQDPGSGHSLHSPVRSLGIYPEPMDSSSSYDPRPSPAQLQHQQRQQQQPPPPVSYYSQSLPSSNNYQNRPSHEYQNRPSHERESNNAAAVDDFGAFRPTPSNPFDGPAAAAAAGTGPTSGGGGGGRFATFPVKLKPLGLPGYTLQDTPSDSLSASIAEALGDKSLDQSGSNTNYNAMHQPLPLQEKSKTEYLGSSGGARPPPPGAAMPDLDKKWGVGEGLGVPGHRRQISDNDDALLAYMTSVEEEVEGRGAHKGDGEADSVRVSRHVRFGSVEDVDAEREVVAGLRVQKKEFEGQDEGDHPPEKGKERDKYSPPPVITKSDSNSSMGSHKIPRIPPPALDQDQDITKTPVQEHTTIPATTTALHAPLPSPLGPSPSIFTEVETHSRLQSEASTIDQGRQPAPDERERDASPLIPLSAPFAQRSPFSPPYAEVNQGQQHPQLPPASQQQPPHQPQTQYALYPAPLPGAAAAGGGGAGSQPPTPITPAQAYAQSYQLASQASSHHPIDSGPPPASSSSNIPPQNQNNLPPRLQALNAASSSTHNELPPRFQTNGGAGAGAAAGGGRPPGASPPPRFQAGGSGGPPSFSPASVGGGEYAPPNHPPPAQQQAHPPWYGAKPDGAAGSPLSQYRSLGVAGGAGAGGLYAPSNASLRSASGPNLSGGGGSAGGSPNIPSLTPGSARTISAAAFKRPPKVGNGNASSDNLSFGGGEPKWGLPGTPYPAGAGQGPGPGPGQAYAAAPQRQSVAGEEDQYDYINAYMGDSGSAPASPMRRSFGDGSGASGGANANVAGRGRPGTGGGGGYGQGNFSTRLEDDLR